MEEERLEDKAISVRKFVSARAQELIALSSRSVPRGNGNEGANLPYKHIPKHLRRRAVSHNVKRIPSRYRPSLKKGLDNESGNIKLPSFVSTKKKKKQFSRKHRRRNSNLLDLYNRRQRFHKWMETHIWHAKRFHMDLKWNCKVPISSCEKGRRAIYRAAKRYVTMQDISFMSCLELTGNFDDLCNGFALIAPKPCNTLSVGALMYKNGEREGTLYVYKSNSYPLGFIGQIQFTWLKRKVVVGSENVPNSANLSSLWLWVHPAFKDEFVQELVSLFNLTISPSLHPTEENEAMDISATESKLGESLSIDSRKLLGKQLHCGVFWFNSEKNISLKDLYGELNRIRFYGPDAFIMLKEALHVYDPEKSVTESSSPSTRKEGNFWLPSENVDHDDTNFLLAQSLLWSILDDSTNIPSHTVLPLIVRDPRVFLPQSRTRVLRDFYGDENEEDHSKDFPREMEDEEIHNVADDGKKGQDSSTDVDFCQVLNKFTSIAQSPLENPDIRLKIVKEKMTDKEYCRRRAELLIPGSQIDLGVDENQVPVILIQRPASSNSKSFSDEGFDLILPAGWVMAFWISFVYRAVRVAGLRDSATFAFESSNLHSLEYLAPDSTAGCQVERECEAKVRSEFFKLPPAKRSNLIKLGCCSPFTCDWNNLLDFWQQYESQEDRQSQEIATLRSHSSSDDELVPRISSFTPSKIYILRNAALLETLAQNLRCNKWSELYSNLSTLENPDYCLIGIRIESLNRGKASKGAVICLPSSSDFDNLCSVNKMKKITGSKSDSKPLSTKYTGKRNVSDPPIHTEPARDENELSRKRSEFRQKHQKFLAYLRKKRKKLRDKVKQNLLAISKSKQGHHSSEQLLDVDQEVTTNLLHYDSSKVSQLYNEQINEMWLVPPDKILQNYKENSRIPMGLVLYGGDEYSKGKCSALGFVSANSLSKFAKMAISNNDKHSSSKWTNIILWRNWQDSLIYRAAKFQICLL